MVVKFDELRVLKIAENIADDIWQQVSLWSSFEKSTVGKQLTRAADSIGANIAEAYGRFHYGEKLQFLYFARGSLFETKYWINRTAVRKLLPQLQTEKYANELSQLAHQLNTFAKNTKSQKYTKGQPGYIREPESIYQLAETTQEYQFLFENDALFSLEEIEALQTTPNFEP
ncbi:MAG: four helix bundle protein [Anaerolineales bacterium]|nr:four helix bundle protein [Anaerolineales bacterium]